jgi:uncharacterized YccA/Bax inhibitor family protein
VFIVDFDVSWMYTAVLVTVGSCIKFKSSIQLPNFMVIFYVLGYAVHHGNSMMSIGISVFVIIIAALNLFLDFDRIEKEPSKMPKFMEWYGAMGLMVTLVWLYIEFYVYSQN